MYSTANPHGCERCAKGGRVSQSHDAGELQSIIRNVMRGSSWKSKRKIVDGEKTQDSCGYIHRRATGYVTADNRLVMVMIQG